MLLDVILCVYQIEYKEVFTTSIFSERISHLRKARGFTQQQACDLIGIESAQVLSNYENDRRKPNIELIARFARAYSVSADYLLGLSDHENPANVEISERLGLTDKTIENIKLVRSMQLPKRVQDSPYYKAHFYEFILDTLFESDIFRQFVHDAETLSRSYTSLRDKYTHEEITTKYNDEIERKFNFRVYQAKETIGRTLVYISQSIYENNIDHAKLKEYLEENKHFAKPSDTPETYEEWIEEQRKGGRDQWRT